MADCVQLENGITLLMDPMEHVRSASVGFLVETGSRDEDGAPAGISHFTEHLLFKGTEHRTAQEISLAFDSVGGDCNADTDRESTLYYARILSEHLPMAIEIIGDMLRHPLLDPGDVELERRVVEEEIRRCEDSPSELVHDLFFEALWPHSPLGRNIMGTVESLREISREDLLRFLQERYHPGRMIVSVAGYLHGFDVPRLIREAFDGAVAKEGTPLRPTPTPQSLARLRVRDLEQVHFVMGWEGAPMGDDRRLAQAMIDCTLGGTASSRLFQEVREKRGLAYAVWTTSADFSDTGAFSIYVGTRKESLPEVLRLIKETIADVAEQGITSSELELAKNQYKAATVLSLESVSSRMIRNCRSYLAFGRVLSIDEMIRRIESVTLEQVREWAREMLEHRPLSMGAVGPVDGEILSDFFDLPANSVVRS